MDSPVIIECVPNFSEGRDRQIIDAIASAISAVEGVSLLDVDPGADTNRTVYTFVGAPEAVLAAAKAAALSARELIDMRCHRGEHPRMGALDVCPFIPVSGASMADCIAVSRRFGEFLGSEIGVPVFLYEAAATQPGRRLLADIRSGEYENLCAKLSDPAWQPDFGPATFDARWGATVTGAREFLIAYNVNLNTTDRRLANEIALTIREAGRLARDASGAVLTDPDGQQVRQPGLLPSVRAIGWYIESYRCAQVSINLTDFRTTPLHRVYDTVRAEAEKLGVLVTGSELVGLVPLDAMIAAGRHYLQRMGKSPGAPERDLVDMAVRSMGLAALAPFDIKRKIIEYACSKPGPLVSLKVDEFLDEVSKDTVAPGGGSVAALAGSLGAALAAMVANIAVGKLGRGEDRAELTGVALSAQSLKASLAAAVDEDTRAFNAILEAGKLPKSTPELAAARLAAQAAATERASRVPLGTARDCLEAIGLCAQAAKLGIPSSISDARVGAIMAAAGLQGAILNVRTNIASMPEDGLKAELETACQAIEEAGRAALAQALSATRVER